LNLSHASFNALKTAPLIMRCSVVASWGICIAELLSAKIQFILSSMGRLTLSGWTLAMAFM
jgi:hypothetical protein